MAAILKNKWILITIIISCWAIAASSASGYYFYQYNDLISRIGGLPASINLCVDYANGTRQWSNGTVGATLYDAMVQAGWEIETASFGIAGLYVSSINHVAESANAKYWGWWSWTDFGWMHGGSACDKYVVGSNESIIWYYSDYNATTWELSPPP